MDHKHDKGTTVRRVRSTKFPFFKEESTVHTEDFDKNRGSAASRSPSSSPTAVCTNILHLHIIVCFEPLSFAKTGCIPWILD
jgi:hypothetical protein